MAPSLRWRLECWWLALGFEDLWLRPDPGRSYEGFGLI